MKVPFNRVPLVRVPGKIAVFAPLVRVRVGGPLKPTPASLAAIVITTWPEAVVLEMPLDVRTACVRAAAVPFFTLTEPA